MSKMSWHNNHIQRTSLRYAADVSRWAEIAVALGSFLTPRSLDRRMDSAIAQQITKRS